MGLSTGLSMERRFDKPVLPTRRGHRQRHWYHQLSQVSTSRHLPVGISGKDCHRLYLHQQLLPNQAGYQKQRIWRVLAVGEEAGE